MKRKLPVLLLAALLTALTIAPLNTTDAKPHFTPPDLTQAGDIPYPFDNIASGIVTVSVSLNSSGQPTGVQVLRDIPGLTSAVSSAVQSWTYSPGMLGGSAVASQITVSVVFNPGGPMQQALNLPQVASTTAPNPPGYFPPEISQATWATYPMNSVASGTVVLDLTIGKQNYVQKVTTIHGVAPLSTAASSAISGWSVNAATYNGSAMQSKVIVAFVFRAPITTP